MVDNGIAATVLNAAGKADANRPSTKEDVATLIGVYKRISGADKDHKEATSNLRKSLAVWSDTTEASSFDGLMDAVRETAERLASELFDCRAIIAGLPNGVTGPGGQATKQTVVMEFYAPVNRNLGHRLTASDAKSINKAAFGK